MVCFGPLEEPAVPYIPGFHPSCGWDLGLCDESFPRYSNRRGVVHWIGASRRDRSLGNRDRCGNFVSDGQQCTSMTGKYCSRCSRPGGKTLNKRSTMDYIQLSSIKTVSWLADG
jgi:hypothetical protein